MVLLVNEDVSDGEELIFHRTLLASSVVKDRIRRKSCGAP